MSNRPISPLIERLWPLTVIAGSYLLFFLRFGYDSGHSDQDEVLPYLLHRLDPNLFTQDWFVQTLADQFNVRTYFVSLLELLTQGVPIETALLLVYLASWFSIGYALFVLARSLGSSSITPALVVLLALVLTPQWTLGGNDLVHRMLVPTMPAWGLGLWGVHATLNKKLSLAGLLFGLACWFQVLVGLQLVGITGLALLLQRDLFQRSNTTLKSLLPFSLVFVVASAPSILPLAIDQVLPNTPILSPSSPDLFYILAAFRAPHHYLPLSFSPQSTVRFLLLGVLLLGCLTLPRIRSSLQQTGFLRRALFVVVILLMFSLLFTEVWPSLFITKLQLFKSTVLVKVLALIVLSDSLMKVFPERFLSFLQSVAFMRIVSATVWFGLMLLITGLTLDHSFVSNKVGPRARQGTDLEQVVRWCRGETPIDAVFAVPPSVSSFRYEAQRAILINHKAFPFQDEQMIRWFDRLMDLAPIPLPRRSTSALVATLDLAYEEQDAASLSILSRTYNLSYIIRQTALPPDALQFNKVYASGPWTIYQFIEQTGR